MAAPREIKARIKSFNSSRQITKAMELVSIAKMRRASESTNANRPYATRLWEIVGRILSASEEGISHPLLEKKEGNHTLLIAIASDKGLAGAYNNNILKQALKYIEKEKAVGNTVSCITIGKRIHQALEKRGVPILQNYPLPSSLPTLEDLHALYNFSLKKFNTGNVNKVEILYTNFFSMVRQEATIEPLLPLTPEITPIVTGNTFLFEPTPEVVLDTLLPYIVEVRLYQAVLESVASEHSSRRLAMKNATDNATTVINRLTLTYNGLRQGAITQEIAEITSGAAALQ